ncbi:MAG: MFS transporter, partial [Clostridia bacterium]|nr:MFS transporter [Clostridia bacterium]
MDFDVIIIGAGPGGIFAAYELVQKRPELRIAVFEAGQPLEKRHCPIDGEKITACIGCKHCSIMSGFGGAGAFSDGKYNITNDFGGTLHEYIGKREALALMRYVDDINLRFGGENTRLYSTAGTKFKKLCIQNDLHLTDVQIGWINTTLSWTLAAMTVVAGFLGDRFSRKWIIALSLVAWSLMTICMGFVGGFVGALFFRSIATGVGESFYAPSAYALIAVHHKETRSVALSIHQAALYVGLMASGLVVAWLLGFLGTWRNVFIAFGAAGCALGVAFVWALKDGRDARPQSGAPASAGRAEPLSAGLRAYFCNPSALCATAGFVAIVFVNNAYLFWAPKFMAMKFQAAYETALNVKAATPEGMKTIVGAAGAQTMLWHHLFAFAAIMLGGVATDH